MESTALSTNKLLLSIPEAAAMLEIGRSLVYELIAGGYLRRGCLATLKTRTGFRGCHPGDVESAATS
jgi:hypothetical protein